MRQLIFYSPILNRLYVFNMISCKDLKTQQASQTSWAHHGLYYIGEL